MPEAPSQQSRIYLAGHRGLVGSAIQRALEAASYRNIITRTHEELDLRDARRVHQTFREEKPEVVILAAAKVGGIGANSRNLAEYLLENLEIETSVFRAAFETGVKKLIFLGSACVFPKDAPNPIREEALLTGPFEPTNEGYGLAKVVGIKLAEYFHKQQGRNFISLQPNNIYGPNDRYHPEDSHVIPAMLIKFIRAREHGLRKVTLWGTGKAKREFLHSDDLGAAVLLAMRDYNLAQFLNVSSGEELSIAELAEMIKDLTNYTGEIIWDTARPDGMMRKFLDTTKIRELGWTAHIKLREGLQQILPEAEQEAKKWL